MRKSIPMTGSSTVVNADPDLEKFRASLNRVWEKTLASRKVRILNDGAFIRRDRTSIVPISQQTSAAIEEFRQELNTIATPAVPAPVKASSAPPPRRAPPPRPAFKRPTALQK
ncbi:hypothetical protein [Agrobacterium sp. B1(2019)]|uniref:hypothetical protein n=1 Tax=Agrobacterium sp. B1(2019) TaxID=2607032 RepID=UPI0011EF36C8|nr:hypothetical protein [Agrobacterium sp. B1(2019)]TZG36620.1 hypothetical protein AGR1_03740 [Agrobacterium sp. B1(2019)]